MAADVVHKVVQAVLKVFERPGEARFGWCGTQAILVLRDGPAMAGALVVQLHRQRLPQYTHGIHPE